MSGRTRISATAIPGRKRLPGGLPVLVPIALLLTVFACGSNGTTATPAPVKSWGTAQVMVQDNEIHNFVTAVDPAGNLTTVWEQKDALNPLWIAGQRYTTGSGWDCAVILSVPSSADAVSPKIAADNAGNATAVWYQDDGSGTFFNRVWATRYVADAGTQNGWQAAQPIDDGTGNAIRVALAVNAGGTAFAAWRQYDGASGYNFIWVNRYLPGAGWEGPRRIEDGNAGDADWPDVAADEEGNAIVVWYQDDGSGVRNVWSNRYSAADNSWEGPGVRQGDSQFDAITPRIAMDRDGNGVAVWREAETTGPNPTGPYSVWSAHFDASGVGWQEAQRIGEGDATGEQKNAPHVAMDRAGNAMAVWAESDGSYFHVYSNRYVPGTNQWGAAATRLESDNTMQSLGPYYISPFVATDPSGNAVAVWTKPGPCGHMGVYAAHYAAGSGWGPAALVGECSTGDADKPVVTMDLQGNAYATWEVNDVVRTPGRGYLAIYR
jgi:hypothetical protein